MVDKSVTRIAESAAQPSTAPSQAALGGCSPQDRACSQIVYITEEQSRASALWGQPWEVGGWERVMDQCLLKLW